jgi:hypothetical protein
VGADFDRAARLEGPFRSPFRPDWYEDCVPDWHRYELLDALEWFDEHLTVPPFWGRRRWRTAVCWFRSDAGEPLARMWDLAILLKVLDVPVRLLRSHEPGRVVWHDEHQVVADPRRR